MIDAYYDFKTNGVDLGCDNQCPIECSHTHYDVQHSSSIFPSRQYAQDILADTQIKRLMENAELTYSNLRESILSLHIYYEELEYTMISEQPALSLIDVISNVGGTLGLFIGISLLSIFEILEIAIKIISVLCKHKSKSWKQTKFHINSQTIKI